MITKLIRSYYVILISCVSLIAQEVPKKMSYGKVSEEMLKLKTYEKDSTANAFVIGDVGRLYFDVKDGKWVTYFKRHTRIKVFNKEGYDQGDISIPYYMAKNSEEKVTNIKGSIYSLENGKIVKEKISGDDVIKEEIDKNHGVYKITFPNLKEGCVFEYTYVHQSEFTYNINDWDVQREIPVLFSSYNMEIPEYFKYQVTNSRYYTIPELQSGRNQKTFNLRITPPDGGRPELHTFDEDITVRKWRAEYVPAFKEEPFMTSPHDYLGRLEFELLSSNYDREFHSSSWKKVMNELRTSVSVGGQLGRTSYMKAQLEAIKSETEDPMQRAFLAFELVKNRMMWDGKATIYSKDGLKKPFLEKKGSSADINLMLVAALQELDVAAVPLFTSTRNYGKIVRSSPKMTQLNYVLACVNINDKIILLDATDKLLSFGMLPKRALSYQGVVMSDNSHVNGEFINIKPSNTDYESVRSSIVIGDDFSANAEIIYTYKGYGAYRWRKKLVKEPEEEEYLTKIEEKHSNVLIDEYSNENKDKINDFGKENFKVTFESVVEKVGDKLFYNPMQMIEKSKNPFTQEARKYPIEFPFPIARKFMIETQLPKGYVVSEVPKPIIMKLPENAGKLRYSVQQSGDKIIVIFDLKIQKQVFLPTEYGILKSFFDKIYQFETNPIMISKREVE
ncbi:DUF3858 domain-containing protein [Flammeovirga agarivorans]|uniref:DUF3857 domain-containing protein n=1 Tax=Flammeovirga agarivorans TaxID=2726742 RepID=A0A7X8SGB8_9BACT|nr:DUF3858 domain-containing protein [Flammeovirga agarivorans]NLR89730.1 DUF3857 domain-containing protein [Flammeovirga agarivorans]